MDKNVGESIRRKLGIHCEADDVAKALREYTHSPLPNAMHSSSARGRTQIKKRKREFRVLSSKERVLGEHSEDTRTESRGMQECSPCVEVPGPTRCTESSKKG